MTEASKPERTDDVEAVEAPPQRDDRDRPISGEQRAVRRRPAPSLLWRAASRWMAITTVMTALLVVYTQHPYYRQAGFTPFRSLYVAAFLGFVAFGLPYVKATITKFSAQRYVMRDGGLHLVLLFVSTLKGKGFWRLAKKPRIRTTLLGILVKAFFTPLMMDFFAGHLNKVSRAWLQHKHLPALDFKVAAGASVYASAVEWWRHVGVRLHDFLPSGSDFAALAQPWRWSREDLGWGVEVAYNVVFLIDCGFALLGYASESRWFRNKTRSVEPTVLGWAACIFCYPPYNSMLGTYLPLKDGEPLFTNDTARLVLRCVTVLLFVIYAAATVSFGLKFSNLTNRGIVQRGPYRFVRHPAYLCKCAAWWLEHVPTMTIQKAFFLWGLCGVYALRAWTEERHLSQDPDYREYKRKVPWVLVPGLF